MKSRTPRRRARAFRFSLNALVAVAFLAIGPGSGQALATHGEPVAFCVDGLFSLFLFGFGPPGETDTFTVTSNPGGRISYSASTSGPFTDPFTISMTFNGEGFGRTADFFMKGLDTGTTQVEASSPRQGNVDPLEVIIDRVTDIRLTDSGDFPLEEDPKDPTSDDDFRIFPDVDLPGEDVTPFRRVKAIAATELDTQGLRVEFRGWDVDDPSPNFVVDPNGELGGDNLGSGATIGFNAVTDANGEATTILTVSRQPGDNFRVTASCALGLQNGLSAIGLDVIKANGDPRPDEVKQSGLVTVWRRLHIEADSMGVVVGNELRGVVSRAQNATFRRRNPPFQGIKVILPRTVVDSAGDQVDFRLFDIDEFQGGEIVIGGTPFPVRFSEGNTVWIDAGPDPRTFRNASFELVDDDKLGGSLHDDGTDVPQPDLSFLAESDDPTTNWFADVYIRPVHLPGAEESLPFRINLDEPHEGYCRDLVIPCPAGRGSFDHEEVASDPNFWVVYLLGAYQGPLGTDGDPDTDPFAATDQNRVTLERADTLGHGAAVFFESIRDEAGPGFGELCSAAGVAVHGLAHQFTGPGHIAGDTGIMAAACVDGSGSWSPESERAIRSALAP